MPSNWTYDQACKMAGLLYGSLLARDSDPEGFDYAVDGLTTGKVTVRGLVKQICTSEEFREKYLMNQTPNEFARRCLLRMMRDRTPDPDQIKSWAVRLLAEDWRTVVADMIDSPQYHAVYGDDKIPVWA
jgi:hypothetical protein